MDKYHVIQNKAAAFFQQLAALYIKEKTFANVLTDASIRFCCLD